MGTGEGQGEWEGELGGVLGRKRKRGFLRGCVGDEGGVSVDTCAEMPFSRTSLARLLVGAGGRRGGKESPRLSLQGVTGVLGPVLMELGVLARREDCELENTGRHLMRLSRERERLLMLQRWLTLG